MKMYYDKENRRLVYIGESATTDFWDRHWNMENYREMIERGKNNRFVLKTLEKYIPHKKGKVLEGGCGGRGFEIDDAKKKFMLEFAELRYTSGRGVGYHAGIAWTDENITQKYHDLLQKNYENILRNRSG